MDLERVQPASLHSTEGYGHIVKAGDTIYIAGQASIAKDGSIVGVGDPTAQAEQTFLNLSEALASVGADFSNVAKLTIYLTHREDLPAWRAVRAKYIKEDKVPAGTLVFVSGLAIPDLRIEVEATAVM